jgi:hypothetical protein
MVPGTPPARAVFGENEPEVRFRVSGCRYQEFLLEPHALSEPLFVGGPEIRHSSLQRNWSSKIAISRKFSVFLGRKLTADSPLYTMSAV